MEKEIDREEIIKRIEKLEEIIFNNFSQCEICHEWFLNEELEDTTEMINGGCGYCCEDCIENGEMRWI